MKQQRWLQVILDFIIFWNMDRKLKLIKNQNKVKPS